MSASFHVTDQEERKINPEQGQRREGWYFLNVNHKINCLANNVDRKCTFYRLTLPFLGHVVKDSQKGIRN